MDMIKHIGIIMDRKKGMTKKEFKEYWLKKHAPHVKRTLKEVKGYRVNIPIKEPGKKIPPYEGVGETWFDSYEESLKVINSKEGQKSVADLKNFTRGKYIGFYVEEHVIK